MPAMKRKSAKSKSTKTVGKKKRPVGRPKKKTTKTRTAKPAKRRKAHKTKKA